MRGIILMALSNQDGHLVLTTGNKSELAAGYSTLYGDSVGGFAPLKDVPKTLVWQLARWRNAQATDWRADPPIPENSIDKPPCAELRPGQLDSDSLPDYEVLDACSTATSSATWAATSCVAPATTRRIVDRVLRLVDRAEYKRRQYPPGPEDHSRKASAATGGCRSRTAGANRPPNPATACKNRTARGRRTATRGLKGRVDTHGCCSDPCPASPTGCPRASKAQRSAASGGRCSPPTTSSPPAIFDEAGIAVLLVGDSAANNVFGYDDTVPVTVDELLPLVRAVVRGTQTALVVADLPFGSYQASPQQALGRGAVHEGGRRARGQARGRRAGSPSTTPIVDAGIPVMAHIGFTPQSEHGLGGYRVQGRGERRRAPDRRRARPAGRRRVRRRAGDGARRRRQAGHRGADDPHDRHRRRPRLRRAGAGLAGHGRHARQRSVPSRSS